MTSPVHVNNVIFEGKLLLMRSSAIFAVLVLAITGTAMPEAPTNSALAYFAGQFVLSGATGDLRFDSHDPDPPTLTIREDAAGLRVTLASKDGGEEMVLPADGHDTTYKRRDGSVATARMAVKGTELEIVREIPLKEYRGIPKGHIHSIERWKLSGVHATLKICGHADSVGGVAQFRKSGCQIFKRTSP